MAAGAAEVRNLQLPFDVVPDHGPDFRDWTGQGHGIDDFVTLVEQSPIVTPEEAAEWAKAGKGPGADGPLIDARELDPATEARRFLAASEIDGVPTIRHWRGEFFEWHQAAYRKIPAGDAQARITCHLNTQFRRLGNRVVGDVMGQLKAQSILPSNTESPAWLGEPPVFSDTGKPWPSEYVLVVRNGLIYLPSLVTGEEHFLSATPRFFSTNAAEFNFNIEAPVPSEWLAFLSQLWKDDVESVSVLQEWFGYLLTADTSQQKILGIIGPTRSGKGTIGRVMQGLIGKNANDFLSGPSWSKSASKST